MLWEAEQKDLSFYGKAGSTSLRNTGLKLKTLE